jgi:hypothetical protein
MERHDHADWTKDQLNDELALARELADIPSSPEREARLERRIGCVVFELWWRNEYVNGRRPNADLAYSDYPIGG